MMSPDEPQLRGRLRLRTTAEGGRQSAGRSGYRPQLTYGAELSTSCSLVGIDTDVFELGSECAVTMRLTSWDAASKSIATGMQFELYEGSHLVGTVCVDELLLPTNGALRR